MEEAADQYLGLDCGAHAALPPALVSLAPFSSPSPRRLSTGGFAQASYPAPVPPKRMAWVSLQGRLINAEEASSVRSVGGGLSRDEAIAWELFSPVQRFLIVAVIGVAAAESKKNRLILRLTKSVELRGSSVRKASSGDEMLQYKFAISNEAEPEERRMSDLSDWASSVTSSADIQMNTSAIEQDIYNFKKDNEEKDATIKELTTLLHSSDFAGSKRIAELEDIIRRKNTIITRLKKDMVVLEQKVVHFTRLRRSSFPLSDSNLNSEQRPHMTENLLYDMDSTTSPSSSDSDSSPSNQPHAPVAKMEEISVENNYSTSTRNQMSAPAKPPGSFVRPTDWSSKSRSGSPLKEISTNRKSDSISSSRQKQLIVGDSSRKSRRRHLTGSKDATPQKRWI
ncbi:uncharacterized protein LOC133878283 isoform X2 [Alnus glutinosa]|uniref:uncharacterized protein LOC133878283 isoform X2 n=1 Tax=Alnus glutinosa TaxID=3517 RepID=UPI002D775B6B|nr:uncharacterized protein LOC133878283 isoform X2 [Alnus glutinosa]